MTDQERKALTKFMQLVFTELHPNYKEYPIDEIRQIDETDGDESDELLKYPDYAVRAYYMHKVIRVLRRQ